MAQRKFLVDIDVDGDITGNNLSGTNTGDQDLSGFVSTTVLNDYLLNTTDILTGQLRVDGAQMIGDSNTANVVSTDVQLHIKNGTHAAIRLEDSDLSNTAFDIKVDEGDGFSIISQIESGVSATKTRLHIASGTGDLTVAGKIQIGTAGITTKVPTLAIGDTTNGASLTLRGQSPTIFFDGTAAGKPTLLTDGQTMEWWNGNLDTAGTEIMSVSSSGNLVALGTVAGSNLSGTNTGDQDLSGYLPLAGGTVTGDIIMDFTGTTYSDAIIFRGASASGGEVGIRAKAEAFQIYEPEDASKVWLEIADDPAGNDTALKVNSTTGMQEVYHAGNVTLSGTNTGDQDLSGFVQVSGDTMTGNLTVSIPDGGSYPADTAIFKLHGYGGRGAGIKIKDSTNSAAGSSEREWFVGTGYSSSGFSIGYSATATQSSYNAQALFTLDTSGSAIFAGNITVGAGASTFEGSVKVKSGNKLTLNRADNAIGSELSTDSSGTLILNSLNNQGFEFKNSTTSIFSLAATTGDATFGGSVTGSNLSGTNTGDNAVNSLYSGLTGNVSTDLSTTHGSTTVTINSSDGTNATINGATASLSGIMTNGTQTIGGGKTFNTRIKATGGVESSGSSLRSKLNVWSGSTYAIGMGNSYTHGDLDGYAMTFQMSNTVNRGWWWGTETHTNAQATMSLSTNGNLSVSTAAKIGYGQSDATFSISYPLDVNGTIRAIGDVIAYSDVRVKKNIKTIDNALDKVKALRGVYFERRDDGRSSTGVIAQEIEKILPEVVSTDSEGMKAVAYGNIVGVLIEAIKDQDQQLKDMQKQINDITNKLAN